MKTKLKKSYIFFTLFLCLYQPILFSVSTLYLVTAIALIGLCKRGKRKIINLKSPITKYIITVFIAIIYLFFVISFTSTEYKYLYEYICVVALLIQTIYIQQLLKESIGNQQEIPFFVLSVGIAQCIFVILALIFPFFQKLIMLPQLQSLNASEVMYDLMKERMYGLASPSVFLSAIGLVHGLLSLYVFYFVLITNTRKKILLMFFLLVPCVINARTGGFCAIIAMLFLCGFLIFFKNKRAGICLFILLSSFFLFIAILAIVLNVYRPDILNHLFFAYKDLFNMITGSGFSYYGQELGFKNLPVLQGWEFVFGTGVRNTECDSGYIQDLSLGGFFLVVILYGGFIFSVLCDTIKKNSVIGFKFSLILFFAIANYKGLVGASSSLVILFLILGFIDSKKSKAQCGMKKHIVSI